MCRFCGIEFCTGCFSLFERGSMPEQIIVDVPQTSTCLKPGECNSHECHTINDFLYITRFSFDNLRTTLHIFQSFALQPKDRQPSLPRSKLTMIDNVSSWEAPRFPAQNTDIRMFRSFLSAGVPVVVGGMLDRLNFPWTPGWFVSQYGDQEVSLVDCETDEEERSTVRDFFQLFGHYNHPLRLGKRLKLKDWPPQSDFSAEFPELFKDFANTVPFPDYVRYDGKMNLASYFATNAQAPDLGE